MWSVYLLTKNSPRLFPKRLFFADFGKCDDRTKWGLVTSLWATWRSAVFRKKNINGVKELRTANNPRHGVARCGVWFCVCEGKCKLKTKLYDSTVTKWAKRMKWSNLWLHRCFLRILASSTTKFNTLECQLD